MSAVSLQEEEEEEEHTEATLRCMAAAGRRSARWRSSVLGGVLLAAGVIALLLPPSPPRDRLRAETTEETTGAIVGLQSWSSGASQLRGGLPSGIMMPPPMSPMLDAYFKQMMGIPSSAVDRHDGNLCADNEEAFGNLCYKKCSLLTNGKFHLRTSAWTCCQAEKAGDCFVKNQDKDFGLCSGYDVGGDGRCPHVPGKCLETEEIFLGQCYEKCSLLTNNRMRHRTSAISCCETPFSLTCFKPGHVSLNSGFNEGGGKGDGDPATPRDAHQPIASLTEAAGVPVSD